MELTVFMWQEYYLKRKQCLFRVQRKSVLQPDTTQAVPSTYVLAHKSFQLAPKRCLIRRIDYNPSVI